MAIAKKSTKSKTGAVKKAAGKTAKKNVRKKKNAVTKKTAGKKTVAVKKTAMTEEKTEKTPKMEEKPALKAELKTDENIAKEAAAPSRRSVIAVKKVEKAEKNKGARGEAGAAEPREERGAAPAEISTDAARRKISLEHPDEEHVDNVGVNFAGQRTGKENVQKEIENYGKREETVPADPLSDIYHGEDLLSKRGERVREVVTSEVVGERERREGGFIDTRIKARRSVKLYRKIALIFVCLTVVLLSAIFYFSFTKVTITLIPNQERVSNNMIIDIYDNEKSGEPGKSAVGGVVRLAEISREITYESSGTEVIGEEVTGKVTIRNDYTKNQPLVATTRLLTPDGKLYRLKNTVNVPAGGSVEAEIYADKPGAEMAIGPTKFTIPGLWAGLQDKIYAENSEPIIYKQKLKKHVQQADIDNCVRDLKKELLDTAKKEINDDYREYSQIIYNIDENTIKSKIYAKAGDEKDGFEAEMSAQVAVVAFDDRQAGGLAKQKFVSSLPENKELVSFDANNIIYSLSNYNYNEGEAAVNASFDGKVTLKENYEIVEKNKILGLNSSQLDAYLSGLPEIAGFEVRFFPAFIKKVPRLADRVEIIVKK